MSFSSTYFQLDGVEFKVSDVINPPPLPTLPKEFKMNDVPELLSDSMFDFSLETSILAKISSVREAEKKMAEKEEKRKMHSMKRRADAEKCRLEEMMSQQREVLQKKREEFLEQKRKKQQEKNCDSPENMSPTTDISNTSPTYENVEAPPIKPVTNPFANVQDGILTPQPVTGKTPESTTKLNQSQPAVSGQSQIWEDFEDKELDPFTNVELKTIDDLAELQAVLQKARIGQGLNVATDVSEMKQDQSQEEITDRVDSLTPSPTSDSSSEEAKISAPLYENISLQEVNEIAAKLEEQNEDSFKDMLQKPENTSSFSSNSTKSIPTEEQSCEPVYAKVHKTQHNQTSGNNLSYPFQTSLNPNNPFVNASGFNAVTTGSKMHTNFPNSTQPPIGYSPSLTETSNQSTLYENLFNPVSTELFPTNTGANSNSDTSASTSTFVNNSGGSKILPVSFGPSSAVVTTPSLQGTPKPSTLNSNQPINAHVVSKPPMPAPRKPPIPPRQSPSSSSTSGAVQVSSAMQNGPSKGHAHLLPPYAIPHSSETNSMAPSTDSGFIHQSKQDRAKFAETVNKALSSLPQNPVPVQKKTQNIVVISNHETQPSASVTRTLSLNSSLIAGLTAKEQTFVKKMMSMGFEAESTVRAMQQFGLDDKEVVDHLIQVQAVVEQGFTATIAQDALEMYPKDGKSVVVYLTKFRQLADMGFPEDKVRDALNSNDSDQAKALDQLMEAS